jgi:hypothetical protein
MILPPLSELVEFVPAGYASEDPSRWLAICLKEGLDYLAIVDGQGSPVTVLTLAELLSLNPLGQLTSAQEAPSSQPDIRTSCPLHLLESHPAWAQTTPYGLNPDTNTVFRGSHRPLRLITDSQPLDAIVQTVLTDPSGGWVVVNRAQRYRGLLNVTRLLAIALSQTAANPDPAETDPAPLSMPSIPVPPNSTALLTYLGHELKTPLTSLLGLSSLLRMSSLGELTPRQTRYVGLIQQHCRRLAAWVNTLIDLGRIDSGTFRIIPQVIDLPTLWQDAYHQALLRIGKEGVLPTDIPSPLAAGQEFPLLIADPSRLQQMLSCMMQTALALNPPESDHAGCSVTAFPLTVEIWQDYLAFLLQVETSDAFSLDQLSHTIFTPGLSAVPTPLTPLSAEIGHWLEWLLVRKLAQLHQGELALTVHPQKGICPILLLPAAQSPSVDLGKRLLLLVAPLDASLILPLAHQVSHMSYHLLVTPHVQDAIELTTRLALATIVVWVETPDALADIQALKLILADLGTQVVAIMPPKWSSLLGESVADRELLWPTHTLGSVLLQPSSTLPSPNRLTILYLKGYPGRTEAPGSLLVELRFPQIFHEFGCRVLEVDDVEQAELLCRVWKPNVAILDPAIANPSAYFANLCQSPQLAKLPLITLTLATTQAAHEHTGLRVFPCLVGDVGWETPEARDRMSSWLVQVLQTAASPPQ